MLLSYVSVYGYIVFKTVFRFIRIYVFSYISLCLSGNNQYFRRGVILPQTLIQKIQNKTSHSW